MSEEAAAQSFPAFLTAWVLMMVEHCLQPGVEPKHPGESIHNPSA
jgi:hypothetical protein